ncbi:hypothetical protein, variant 1 [Aphanomyces astaci]|uniref:Uncharacterized protein n=1 Tax=Aphanomyces astaci TaxID=112090 RepID=W4FZ89_APHAT|nr:hypothetical protein, variant 1 [Aphanomyces astaci]ETV72311.1 hypothetical protein, variant 1 [Aphanomyces astaci]|eukprot:XP_009837993.1 hypothetical protein, variant 1 [Aphanomyces astaci]
MYIYACSHYDGHKFGDRVDECGFPDHHPPPLQVLVDILNRMLDWYTRDPDNVVVVHCMAGKGRTGVVVTCFLIVIGFFEDEYGISIYHKSDQDLLEYVQMVNGIFWKKRGQGVRYPSQARYVYYFTKYLSRLPYRPDRLGYRLPPLPRATKLFLRQIVMTGMPYVDAGGCSPFLLVHPAPSEHVPSKLLYNSAWDTPQLQSYTDPHTTLVFRTECVVEGDFLVRIFHANATAVLGKKESQLCHFTLRTDFVTSRGSIVLTKADIDGATDHKRFPDHFSVACEFEPTTNLHSHPHNQMLPDLVPHDVRQKECYIKRGWLFKQGGFVQNWKRRWCVAKDGTLTYYKSDTNCHANGSVALQGATVNRWQCHKFTAKVGHPCHFFKVEPPSSAQKRRVYYFGADTESDLVEWMRVVQASASPQLQRSQSAALIGLGRHSHHPRCQDNSSFVSTTSSCTGHNNNNPHTPKTDQYYSNRSSMPTTSSTATTSSSSGFNTGSSTGRVMARLSFDDRMARVEATKKATVVSTYEYSTEELLAAADLQAHLQDTGQFVAFCEMPRVDAVQLVLLLAHDMFPSLLDAVDEDSAHMVDMVAGRESFK